MKRKRGVVENCSENAEPSAGEDGTDKRRKLSENTRGGRWRYTANTKDVTVDLLEDMGVNIIEDGSNDSNDIPVRPPHVKLVLKTKDQNIRKTVQTCSELDLSHDSASCSSLTSIPLGHVSDDFCQYTRSRTRPDEGLGKEDHDTFNLMSEEVVLHIFKWLPKTSLARCALVCKRWRRLVKDDSLWKRMDLGLRNIQPGVIGQVLSRGSIVLRLSRSTVAAPIFSSPTAPTFSASQISKLQYLDVSMATIDISCLEQLLSTCRHLKKLALEHVTLSEEACKQIGKNTSLEVLHLALCQGVSDEGVNRLFGRLTKLRELNLSWTDASGRGLSHLVGLLPPSLERLNLAGYRSSLQDAHVEELVGRCNNIRELDLSDATQITVTALNLIADNLLRLESLSTSRCYAITPTSYLILVNCPSLLNLNVYGLLREEALNQLKEQLKGITMNNCPLSSVARPTVGIKRSSLWNLRVRD